MKVYVITTGKYSDRRIVGVTADPSKIDSDRYDINEFELGDVQDVPPGYNVFSVIMDKYGRGDVYDEPVSYLLDGDEWTDATRMHRVVVAKDEEHAVKIVNEQRAQLIASGQW